MSFPRLSELTAVIEAPVIAVAEETLSEASGKMAGLIEKWMDQNKAYSMEGPRGERNFEKLVRVLGYSSLSEFFGDNSGALEAMVTWLGKMNNTEWVEAMQAEVGHSEADKDEEDDE